MGIASQCAKRDLRKKKKCSALLCQKLFVDVVATFALSEGREREVRTKFLAGWAQSEVQEMRTSCLLSQHVHVCVLCVCVPSETPQGVTEAAAAAAASVTVAQLQHICVPRRQ